MASSPTPAMDLPTILSELQGLLGRRDISLQEFQNWEGGAANGGPNGDGIYPLTDSTGFVRNVACPAKIIADVNPQSPEAFGAIGDGGSHPASTVFATLAACQAVYPFASSLMQEMDFLAWQKMVNQIGSFRCPGPRTYKMCNSDPASMTPLNWVAGRCDVDAAYSLLDWSDMVAQTSDAHFVGDYDFVTAGNWVNSTLYPAPGSHTNATFNSGAAVMIDDHDGSTAALTGNPYYEWGQAINPPPGTYRVILEGTATRGVSFDHGNLNPPYLYVSFTGNQVGQGDWISSRYVGVNPSLDKTNPTTTAVPFSAQFDFIVQTQTPGFITFKGGGYVNFTITRLDIVPFIPNCGILNNRDGAPSHYFKQKRFRRAYLGGSPNWSGLTGGLWKSFTDLDGDLQDWEEIRTNSPTLGWDSAVELSDGAYLVNFFDCEIISKGKGIYAGIGTYNAGENIRFYGGVVSGDNYIFNNPGGFEFTMFATAVDYPGKGVCEDNAGVIRMIGVHHEQYGPLTVPIWHCTTGRVIYDASLILIAGTVNGATVPPAQLDTTASSMEIHSTQAYNLSSAVGTVASGAGRVEFYGFLNNGNPNIGPDLITAAGNQDMLGGAGLFEGRPSNELTFRNAEATPIHIPGGFFTGDKTATMMDRWNSTTFQMTVSTDYAWSGAKSLKVQKLGNADASKDAEIQFLIPIRRPGNLIGRMFFLTPNPVTAPGYSDAANPFGIPIFFRYFWVEVIGYDTLGRPILSDRGQFKGEQTVDMPLVGSSAWVKRNFSSLYQPADTGTEVSDKSPVWATHFAIVIDCQSLPPTTFYIDGLQANFIG